MSNIITTKALYDRQNRLIHKGFSKIGLSYSENKEYWLDLCEDLCGRTLTGLSNMTLGERRELIAHLQKQKAVSSNLYVPRSLFGWKHGEPDQTVSFTPGAKQRFPGRPENILFNDPDKGRMLKKIEAMLAEAKRPWAYAHSMAKNMSGVDRIQWCPPDQMHKIVSAMVYDAIRHDRKTKQENRK